MEFTVNEQRILTYIEEHRTLSSLEEIKLVYGLRVLIREAKKAVIIYGISLLIGVFWELLVVQLGFLLVRQVAYGFHLGSFKKCLVISGILFPFLTWMIVHSSIQSSFMWLIYFISFLLLIWLGPTNSAKNKVRNKHHMNFLRRKIHIRLIIVGILLLFTPNHFGILFVSGMALAVILVILAKYK